jgi:hypothetical protein
MPPDVHRHGLPFSRAHGDSRWLSRGIALSVLTDDRFESKDSKITNVQGSTYVKYDTVHTVLHRPGN